VKWRVRRQENLRGEWSVFDPLLDYRVCHYNHARHQGAHLHAPSDSPKRLAVDIRSADEAEAFMRAYAARHDTFEPATWAKELTSWRSASNAD
jgi:hypothetical protein